MESMLCMRSWVHDELKIGKSLYFGILFSLYFYTLSILK
ncbi:hypothetical protein LINPERPRIM_LOCUS32779 [Linum perenne]